MVVSFDIETVASPEGRKIALNGEFQAPSTWKDPKKIEQRITDMKHAAVEKAGLHWTTGSIICICAYDTITTEKRRFYGANEPRVITDFYDWMETRAVRKLTGKNSDEFDKPFLIGRSIALNIGVPSWLKFNEVPSDIDKIFGFSKSGGQRATLEKYALAMGLNGKLGHGSAVQGWYDLAAQGDQQYWDRIVKYCEMDVEIVAELVRRYTKPYPNTEVPEPLSEDEIPFGV